MCGGGARSALDGLGTGFREAPLMHRQKKQGCWHPRACGSVCGTMCERLCGIVARPGAQHEGVPSEAALRAVCASVVLWPCDSESQALGWGPSCPPAAPRELACPRETMALHIPPESEWLWSGHLPSAPGCPQTSRRRAVGWPAGAVSTAGCGGTGTGTTLGRAPSGGSGGMGLGAEAVPGQG